MNHSPSPHLLMCPPDYFGIEYEINPWMDRRRPADHAVAVQQWKALHALLRGAGATISLLTPTPGLPDMVFTANAALIYRQQAIVSRFRHPQRQGEEPHSADWLGAHGFECLRLEPEQYFEGAGDALFCGETLFAGYRIRSDAGAMQHVGKLLQVHVIALELIDPRFYHLDTCFCPLSPTIALYYPGAFDDYGRKVLEQAVGRLIPVDEDEAAAFACNAVVIGQHVFTNAGCPRLHADLQGAGFTPQPTPLDQFARAGGSAKCLTLRLDGEDAAQWKAVAASERSGDARSGDAE